MMPVTYADCRRRHSERAEATRRGRVRKAMWWTGGRRPEPPGGGSASACCTDLVILPDKTGRKKRAYSWRSCAASLSSKQPHVWSPLSLSLSLFLSPSLSSKTDNMWGWMVACSRRLARKHFRIWSGSALNGAGFRRQHLGHLQLSFTECACVDWTPEQGGYGRAARQRGGAHGETGLPGSARSRPDRPFANSAHIGTFAV